jgi:hypothetical protein
MKRKFVSLILALALCYGVCILALAASESFDVSTSDAAAITAANTLYELGLFSGVGNNADGTPNFDIARSITRHEAVTMLVRLLGKESEALAGSWTIPFTDVADWAKPYVGYAYENGLTDGTSPTTFAGTTNISAPEYLTYVLRALGYSSVSDFAWNTAWELTNELGVTNGEYDGYGKVDRFCRGDAAIVSANALDIKMKDSTKTLFETIEDSLATLPYVIGKVLVITNNLVEHEPYIHFLASATVTNGETLVAEGLFLPLEEVSESLAEIQYDEEFQVIMVNQKDAEVSTYSLYNDKFEIVYNNKNDFSLPNEAGTYLLCVDVAWSNYKEVDLQNKEYTINRYIFKIKV